MLLDPHQVTIVKYVEAHGTIMDGGIKLDRDLSSIRFSTRLSRLHEQPLCGHLALFLS